MRSVDCHAALLLAMTLSKCHSTLDKFIRPEHAAAVFEHFYFLAGLSHTLIMVIGALEILVLVGFVLGIQKTITYGLVFIFHAVSTLSSFRIYLTPFEEVNLLFFAAWPMLAACYALVCIEGRRHAANQMVNAIRAI